MIKRVSITYRIDAAPQSSLNPNVPGGLGKAKAFIARLLDHAERPNPCNEHVPMPASDPLEKFFSSWHEGDCLRSAIIKGRRMTIFVTYCRISPKNPGWYDVEVSIFAPGSKTPLLWMKPSFEDTSDPGIAALTWHGDPR